MKWLALEVMMWQTRVPLAKLFHPEMQEPSTTLTHYWRTRTAFRTTIQIRLRLTLPTRRLCSQKSSLQGITPTSNWLKCLQTNNLAQSQLFNTITPQISPLVGELKLMKAS